MGAEQSSHYSNNQLKVTCNFNISDESEAELFFEYGSTRLKIRSSSIYSDKTPDDYTSFLNPNSKPLFFGDESLVDNSVISIKHKGDYIYFEVCAKGGIMSFRVHQDNASSAFITIAREMSKNLELIEKARQNM